jgi:hypothetical protein
VLYWDNTLACECLDLSSSVFFPVLDIWVVAHPQWSTGEDNCADVVIMASSSDGLLVSLWCTSLIGQDESGSDPDSASTEHKSSGDSLSIVDTTSGNDLNWFAGHRAGLAFAELDDSWDQNCCWDITGVSTSLTSLCADDVDTELEALLNVLRVANHVHVENTGLVQTVDDMLGGDTDSRDKEGGARLNDDAHKLIKFALCVVVAICGDDKSAIGLQRTTIDYPIHASACDCLCLLGLTGTSSNLWQKQINTKGCVLVFEEALQFCDLLAKHVWCVSYSSNDTETSGICDCCCELGASCDVHSSEKNRVVDLEQICRDRAELFYGCLSVCCRHELIFM